jgi:5-methylcytosine-specific restriction endonuclease McrA
MPFKDLKDKQEYQRNWLKDRKKVFFKGKKCEKCGSTKNLELHHLDKHKKEDHKIWSWSPARFKKEAAKCKILCRKCHSELHAKEMEGEGPSLDQGKDKKKDKD